MPGSLGAAADIGDAPFDTADSASDMGDAESASAWVAPLAEPAPPVLPAAKPGLLLSARPATAPEGPFAIYLTLSCRPANTAEFHHSGSATILEISAAEYLACERYVADEGSEQAYLS